MKKTQNCPLNKSPSKFFFLGVKCQNYLILDYEESFHQVLRKDNNKSRIKKKKD